MNYLPFFNCCSMISVLSVGAFTGVLTGKSFGTALFSTSASNPAINSDVTSTFEYADAEPGLLSLNVNDPIPQG
jgi:hypothetical protein